MKKATMISTTGTHAGRRVRPLIGNGTCGMYPTATFGTTGTGLFGSTT